LTEIVYLTQGSALLYSVYMELDFGMNISPISAGKKSNSVKQRLGFQEGRVHVYAPRVRDGVKHLLPTAKAIGLDALVNLRRNRQKHLDTAIRTFQFNASNISWLNEHSGFACHGLSLYWRRGQRPSFERAPLLSCETNALPLPPSSCASRVSSFLPLRSL
jgi:hypothetical protein